MLLLTLLFLDESQLGNLPSYISRERSEFGGVGGTLIMGERLQKVLSQWGIASRRQAEQMIVDGRVSINGQIAQLGQRADPICDAILVDGRPLVMPVRPLPLTLLLHKPIGVVSTCNDPQGRPTVLDLLPPEWQTSQGLHPVGRLDTSSTGALLLTNDGQFTFYLTHPSHHVSKTYHVWVQGHPPGSVLRQWRRGIILDGYQTLPAHVKVLSQQIGESGESTCLEITLWEGKNRQIRRTAQHLGFPVLRLHRVAIGPIQLGALPKGQYRLLQPSEIHALKVPICRAGLL